jgi:hypothetical protein
MPGPRRGHWLLGRCWLQRLLGGAARRLIGIGRGPTASPSHPTGRSGHEYGGSMDDVRVIHRPNWSVIPGVPAASSSQRPSYARPLAGCHFASPPPATALFHRSGLQRALACRLCPLLTSAGWSGGIPPPSVLYQDTPQISRGKLSYRRCIDAGFIKHAPIVDGGLCGRVPARPQRTTPHIRFVSLAPHVRSALPSDPTSR